MKKEILLKTSFILSIVLSSLEHVFAATNNPVQYLSNDTGEIGYIANNSFLSAVFIILIFIICLVILIIYLRRKS